MILITSPELADFRRRLKTLDTRVSFVIQVCNFNSNSLQQDGQALFVTLYRSWCHNAVSVFSLCLLAQAYEHASNLLGILFVTLFLVCPFWHSSMYSAELEITVALLVQIDKLVQLIESPVFTCEHLLKPFHFTCSPVTDLRLQLLEPDRNPYLFKCLYGLLMLLPQSTAFVALRNRLNAVNSSGFLHIAPKPYVITLCAI